MTASGFNRAFVPSLAAWLVLGVGCKPGDDSGNAAELTAYDNALHHLATLDIKHGALERAEQMLLALIESNPDHPSAHYTYAQLLLRFGRTEQAETQLEEHMRVQASRQPPGQVATAN